MRIIFTILLLAVFITGAIFLQIFLSKKENKWPGLVLPAITLFFSILAVLGLTFYMPATLTEQSFKIILNAVQIPKVATLLAAIYIVILYNIPTAILLGIYYTCRDKLKRNREIEKMSVQDL
ncbi:hypothetical protein [Lederbergia citrea]|uniref:Uncharacterized protein n=1 Tax=Lederbergia citrea TaxID=2833581 RepID=A0A942Z1T1_9BACI|nr:hypothetical protein [Lederbergia citrea]MBS4176967.1 hypothetical protein [Lederbergia citrea]MBS4221803.1 hypothetical protein [Lederbergia citrea]